MARFSATSACLCFCKFCRLTRLAQRSCKAQWPAGPTVQFETDLVLRCHQAWVDPPDNLEQARVKSRSQGLCYALLPG